MCLSPVAERTHLLGLRSEDAVLLVGCPAPKMPRCNIVPPHLTLLRTCISLAGEVEIDHAAREVTTSMLFKWYKADFGPPDVMLPWLLQARCSEFSTLADADC